jgi:hypothetical protein
LKLTSTKTSGQLLDLSAINLQFVLDEEDDAGRNFWSILRPPVGIATGVANFAVKKCRHQKQRAETELLKYIF